MKSSGEDLIGDQSDDLILAVKRLKQFKRAGVAELR